MNDTRRRGLFSIPVIAAMSTGAALSGWALARAGMPAAAAAAVTAGVSALAVLFSARRAALRSAARVLGEVSRLRERSAGREALLEAVSEATPVALLFYSDSGRIRFANAEARRLFFEGRTPGDENFLRLVASAEEGLRQALLGETDELFNVEVEGQRETYHVARRNIDYDGETHTLLLVRQLTYEVSRREVDVLRKVIRVVSHELNNSLAPIQSLIHSSRLIAKDPAHLDKLDRVFDTIEERAAHLTSFLNGYATLARLPKPRQAQVTWGPLLDRLRTLFPAARVPDGVAEPAWMDAGQMEQLLINLLKNATEAGGAPERVELEVLPEPDGAVKVRVNDRGTGLTKEALESAFLPLYSTKEKGSGMGLALCREVTEAHGGRLSIQNREGGGCVVTCWLPPRRRPGGGTSSRATLTLTRA